MKEFGAPKMAENAPLLQEDQETIDNDDFLNSIVYAINSFNAVLKPISITMILASFVGSNIQSNVQEASFTAFDTSSEDTETDTVRLEKSFANSLIIVGVLATATFGIVCLYKYRFMKVLVGYMMFSSMTLLGVMGGILVLTILDQYEIPCDAFIFYGGCYNFAVVGVIAIFYKSGIPTIVTQSYLVLTALLMAWQLSKFEDWTGWCLLITLAFYDLCAVLTPCGPLKALVNLMQEYEEPMPGLLFEAELHYDPLFDHREEELKTVNNVQNHFINNDTDDNDDSETDGIDDKDELKTEDKNETGFQLGENSFDYHIKTEEDNELQLNVDVDVDELNRSIKLGLGDFVFYGVLVSKAGLASFTSFIICFLVVVLGLGATLVLLSVYRIALPALPISICLGVGFYLLSIFSITPFVEEISSVPLYF